MAIIFADDFKQWPAGGILSLANYDSSIQGVPSVPATYASRLEALGYFSPASHGAGGGAGTYWGVTLRHNSEKDCAVIMSQSNVGSLSLALGTSGMRRPINYTGDTLYVGLCFEFTLAEIAVGDFLYFGAYNTSVSDFTASDGLLASNFLHTVGVGADGCFHLNGQSSNVPAYYVPATVKHYMDVVFKPNSVELWINDTLVVTQSNLGIKIKEIAVSAQGFGSTKLGTYLYSLAISDNSGGFGQRMGRKAVRTQQIQTITTGLTKTAVPAATTELALIRKMADDPWSVTGANMFGNLSAVDGYLSTDFTVFGFPGAANIYGAALQMQSKRMSPSGSGFGILPYATVAGVKKYGSVSVPSSTWKQYTLEIPMTGVPKETTTFGFMFDYTDVNKLYISDWQKIEVYGDPQPSQTTGYLGEVVSEKKLVVNSAYTAVASDYMQQQPTTSKVDVNPTEMQASVFDYGQQTLVTAKQTVEVTSYSKEE